MFITENYPAGTVEYQHKDGNRMYWGILTWPTEKRESWFPGEEEGSWGRYWAFEIWHGGSRPDELMYSGQILHQEEIPAPDAAELFQIWIGSLMGVLVGFARSEGKEHYGMIGKQTELPVCK
jgi:hypothetical protein